LWRLNQRWPDRRRSDRNGDTGRGGRRRRRRGSADEETGTDPAAEQKTRRGDCADGGAPASAAALGAPLGRRSGFLAQRRAPRSYLR
jgi:hypothetical protein